MYKVGQKNNQDRVFPEKHSKPLHWFGFTMFGELFENEDKNFEEKEIFGRKKHKV